MIAAMRRHATVLVAILFALLATPASAAPRALVLDISGPIGPAIADYIVREIDAASPRATGLIVLRMNTPGGLDSSMREIDTAILASPVPVASFVAPSGARAASAGTNIAAATPIQLGGSPLAPGGPDQKSQTPGKAGEPADTESRKIVNDAVAYIRSLAAVNGRD